MSVHVTNQIIKKEWTDYNDHLNMAYYVLIFDKAWEVVLEKFNMGETSAKSTQMSTMVVETHTTYNNEVKENIERELADLIKSKKIKVIIIPDIESVNYGRGVGYDIIEHAPPSEIGEISATKIREKLFRK